MYCLSSVSGVCLAELDATEFEALYQDMKIEVINYYYITCLRN